MDHWLKAAEGMCDSLYFSSSSFSQPINTLQLEISELVLGLKCGFVGYFMFYSFVANDDDNSAVI